MSSALGGRGRAKRNPGVEPTMGARARSALEGGITRGRAGAAMRPAAARGCSATRVCRFSPMGIVANVWVEQVRLAGNGAVEAPSSSAGAGRLTPLSGGKNARSTKKSGRDARSPETDTMRPPSLRQEPVSSESGLGREL
eukprot:CAMPEP_0179857392 /NCGR_PEP_ID=MMETSP0982-20121206/11729_1 /TAXON_ID=483367 /ORGANISM="non described non described, Strain CCMP 2436" /LENGTH=139 /DNA_ID=CAMNT_0021743915 /DNA_START=56 /DNA_END=472 /DNA_ORIENTATION=+